MNKYKAEIKNISWLLRDVAPGYRASVVCGYIAETLDSKCSPNIKLSRISAAIKALERCGRE